MLTLTVGAEMRLIVIGAWTAAWMVFFCRVSTGVCLTTHYSNMAIGPALVALGHSTLTEKHLAVFSLVVVYMPVSNQGACFFTCFHISLEQPTQLAVIQGIFLQGNP